MTVDTDRRTEELQELKRRLYNPEAAAALRRQFQGRPNNFSLEALETFIAENPMFIGMHLLADIDEEGEIDPEDEMDMDAEENSPSDEVAA